MVEYLQELRVKDGNNIRIINSHIFKEKCMSDDELEAKKVEFSRYMQELYSSEGIKLEILENYKSLNYKYEANEYSGSYYFKNLDLTIFFEKCGRKKIVDGIDISLPYEDNPNILDVGKILKLDTLKNIFNND